MILFKFTVIISIDLSGLFQWYQLSARKILENEQMLHFLPAGLDSEIIVAPAHGRINVIFNDNFAEVGTVMYPDRFVFETPSLLIRRASHIQF